LQAIQERGLSGFSLLDIGGGVGAIQHELSGSGARDIVNVDASAAFSQAARQEAERRGYADRAEYHVGDFVRLADSLAPADVVTLDRVVCCYDDMRGLVTGAAQKAQHILGLVYPNDSWYARLGMGLLNLFQRITRNPFRVFIHPNQEVEGIIQEKGFERVFFERGFFWRVVVFENSKN